MSSCGSDLSKDRTSIFPSLLYIGKLMTPSFCTGRSATLSTSHVFPFMRNTPGLRRQVISMLGMQGFKSCGLISGLWLLLLAISIVLCF